MSVLTRVNLPDDIKKLNIDELKALAEELRFSILNVIAKNGGHLSANLGIVETTIALYRAFDFAKDRLIFDVGHQCYAHKILSGRGAQFSSIRTKGGLSGFPDGLESVYDAFGTGHAGTSIASGLGYCIARDRKGEGYFVVSVVGDGALANGLNLEAITASNDKPKKFVVILNDNGMSISENCNGFYQAICKDAKKYFEDCGFYYIGEVDGNDMNALNLAVSDAKIKSQEHAVLLHVKTTKGKGYIKAEEHADFYHGVGENLQNEIGDFSSALGDKINSLIESNSSVVAITCAMKDGTGLSKVEEKHHENFYDVGIAEAFAVTFASGMASGGLKPIIAVYSTFLQRAYDQILHDVCLQNLPVIFCLDRAGLVGRDGKTHQGVFDLSYLTHIPNMTVIAPTTIGEMSEALDYAIKLNSPVAIRYPKNADNEREVKPFSLGLWEKLTDGDKVSLLAVGPRMLKLAQEVARKVEGVAVISARTVKPLCEKTLNEIKDTVIITMEENSVIGGFGALVNGYYLSKGISAKIINLGVGDEFVTHGSVDEQLKACGLTAQRIIDLINGN